MPHDYYIENLRKYIHLIHLIIFTLTIKAALLPTSRNARRIVSFPKSFTKKILSRRILEDDEILVGSLPSLRTVSKRKSTPSRVVFASRSVRQLMLPFFEQNYYRYH